MTDLKKAAQQALEQDNFPEEKLQAVAEYFGDMCHVWYGIGARDVEEVLRQSVRRGLVTLNFNTGEQPEPCTYRCEAWPKCGCAALEQTDQGGKTGWPPGLLQDDCRGLSKWLASRPDARRRVREAVAALEQEQKPELRELLIGAAAMAVAAERKGVYQGASWVADAVLEQPEQEPVAWMLPRTDSIITAAAKVYRGVWAEDYTQPLFTHPPRREWQFLSAEERYRIADESASTIIAVLATQIKLKELNT
jgi:hypothetical protein